MLACCFLARGSKRIPHSLSSRWSPLYYTPSRTAEASYSAGVAFLLCFDIVRYRPLTAVIHCTYYAPITTVNQHHTLFSKQKQKSRNLLLKHGKTSLKHSIAAWRVSGLSLESGIHYSTVRLQRLRCGRHCRRQRPLRGPRQDIGG